MNPHTNGAKTFLYVVRHDRMRAGEIPYAETFLVRSDHDPEADELVRALHLNYDEMHDEIEAIRYSEESVPTLPSKHQ
jgi:hypothetical protein